MSKPLINSTRLLLFACFVLLMSSLAPGRVAGPVAAVPRQLFMLVLEPLGVVPQRLIRGDGGELPHQYESELVETLRETHQIGDDLRYQEALRNEIRKLREELRIYREAYAKAGRWCMVSTWSAGCLALGRGRRM